MSGALCASLGVSHDIYLIGWETRGKTYYTPHYTTPQQQAHLPDNTKKNEKQKINTQQKP